MTTNEVESLKELIGLLGEKNVERLQERIVDIICKRIEYDFECYDCYFFDMEQFNDFFESCAEAAKKKVKKQITERMEKALLEAEIGKKKLDEGGE